MKKLVILVLILFIHTEIQAQKWRPDFSLPLGTELLLNINNQKLNYYLNRNMPRHQPGNCEVELSIFYFRVNSQGKIDSIRVEGSLSKEVSAQVVKNIYKTEGKWKIPNNTKTGDKCWFVYPFFLFGYSIPCSKSSEATYRQIYSLYQAYSYLGDTQDEIGRVIISPNSFAALSEK